MEKLLAMIAVLFCFVGVAQADKADDAFYAVVRISSHGISGTFVHTEGPSDKHPKGYSLILTCAHSGMFDKSINLQAPDPLDAGTGPKTGTNLRFVGIDRNKDLAMIAMDFGPVPHIAVIGPGNFKPDGSCWSCGYDNMTLPPKKAATRIVTTAGTSKGECFITDRPPWHGRSGGPLIDRPTGYVVGVCFAYDGGNGMYHSLGKIRKFLDDVNAGGEHVNPKRKSEIVQRPQRPPVQPQPVAPNCPT